jgi:hypothetical protein
MMAEAVAELSEPAADVVLHRAALAAGKAFGGAKLRQAALGETAALLGWLKSDRPIGRGERLIQANLSRVTIALQAVRGSKPIRGAHIGL